MIADALLQINRTKEHMLYDAWTNFGPYLPHDGSRDGDVNTLQRNRRPEVEFTNDETLSLDEMKKRVTIPRKPFSESGRPMVCRKRCSYRPTNYDISALKKVSRCHEKPTSLWELKTRWDCAALNAPQNEVYDNVMGHDLSNVDAAIPNTDWMISPSDVRVLYNVVTDIAGEAEAKYMQTKILGLPLRRKCDGAMIVPGYPSPEIKWENMLPTARLWRSKDSFRDQIVMHFQIPGVTPNVDFAVDSAAAVDWKVEWLHEALVKSSVRALNAHLSEDEVRAYAPLIKRFSLAKPREHVTRFVTKSTRLAVRAGVQRGVSPRSDYDFAVAFQIFVEANGALFRMDETAYVAHDGMLSTVTADNQQQPLATITCDLTIVCRVVALAQRDALWRGRECPKDQNGEHGLPPHHQGEQQRIHCGPLHAARRRFVHGAFGDVFDTQCPRRSKDTLEIIGLFEGGDVA